MNRSRIFTAAPVRLCVLGLLIISGCGTPLTPEQKQAILKLQERGGRVNYRGTGFEVILTGTQVTDDDLVHIKPLGNVKILDIRGTQITDAGLVHLHGVTSLETVKLQGTKVTREGVKKLQEALPKTLINDR